jgi:hypothetical protein
MKGQATSLNETVIEAVVLVARQDNMGHRDTLLRVHLRPHLINFLYITSGGRAKARPYDCLILRTCTPVHVILHSYPIGRPNKFWSIEDIQGETHFKICSQSGVSPHS